MCDGDQKTTKNKKHSEPSRVVHRKTEKTKVVHEKLRERDFH